ncbi:response regulator [uncultured Acetobacteroides sp.]|uniref:response regulator n=1 Tax=uncultured Acetobacteroides sp. TaxID=1760811 RepID=UPI0029F481B3|nr:response regulator [uncultured Acetobacteroides sp.]
MKQGSGEARYCSAIRAGRVELASFTEVERHTVSILVAEDNVIYQKLMQKLLSSYGYSVRIVDNGADALQALESSRYDFVFMDLQMPVMNGLEATRRIVSRFKDRRPVIIAMTASSLGDDRNACFEAGADDYVCKPILSETLVQLIAKWHRVGA